MPCWTGWGPRRRPIWGHSWESMLPVTEGWVVWRNHQNFTTLENALILCSTTKGENEDLLLFMVPKAHQTAALNGCHWDAGHQCQDCTLSLLQECFWWPGMVKQMRQTIRACTCCVQYEGGLPQGYFMPHCGYDPPGSAACWLHKHWDHIGAKPTT